MYGICWDHRHETSTQFFWFISHLRGEQMRPRRRENAKEDAKKTSKCNPIRQHACPFGASSQKTDCLSSSRLPSRFRIFAVVFPPRRLDKNLKKWVVTAPLS